MVQDRAVLGQESGRRQGPLCPALWCSPSGAGEERGGGGGGKLKMTGRAPLITKRGGGPRRHPTRGGSF